ncbi:TAXI family TRAP transporter solute-binding subunit [Kiloniella sp. b19]|uniref:TAXI family TRAP transporter solute-binding subunit n=1 Tax=Kiloniella sp. GXU_MW_B19 TaxID=3141326 RepID=UPI0031DF3C3B
MQHFLRSLFAPGAFLALGFSLLLPEASPAQEQEERPLVEKGEERFLEEELEVAMAMQPVVEGGSAFFRMGTGSTVSSSFQLGRIIASAISKPYGSRPCNRGGGCGVLGLIATSQSTEGSLQTFERMKEGRLEAGVMRSDVAYDAVRRKKNDLTPVYGTSMRSIANLYPQYLQILARVGSDVRKLEDIRGKRVAIGLPGDGMRPMVDVMLGELELKEKDLELVFMTAEEAYFSINEGSLDAVVMFDSAPSRLAELLLTSNRVIMLQIPEAVRMALIDSNRAFSDHRLPVGTYSSVPPIETIRTPGQLIVRSDLDARLVYEITRALWHQTTVEKIGDERVLDETIDVEMAIDDMIVPLHPGALRFYSEIGLLSGKKLHSRD